MVAIILTISIKTLNVHGLNNPIKEQRRGEDGGRVRRRDHPPPHRYIRNTSTRGTAPIEHPLNASRRPQISQKARNSPRTWPCG